MEWKNKYPHNESKMSFLIFNLNSKGYFKKKKICFKIFYSRRILSSYLA